MIYTEGRQAGEQLVELKSVMDVSVPRGPTKGVVCWQVPSGR